MSARLNLDTQTKNTFENTNPEQSNSAIISLFRSHSIDRYYSWSNKQRFYRIVEPLFEFYKSAIALHPLRLIMYVYST